MGVATLAMAVVLLSMLGPLMALATALFLLCGKIVT